MVEAGVGEGGPERFWERNVGIFSKIIRIFLGKGRISSKIIKFDVGKVRFSSKIIKMLGWRDTVA